MFFFNEALRIAGFLNGSMIRFLIKDIPFIASNPLIGISDVDPSLLKIEIGESIKVADAAARAMQEAMIAKIEASRLGEARIKELKFKTENDLAASQRCSINECRNKHLCQNSLNDF